MLQYDPATSLQHHPTPMSRFGLNPYGENLYRIVRAGSRKKLICGEWEDGSVSGKWGPGYEDIPEPMWILEKWMPPEEFAMCSKETWDIKFSVLGPYPHRGEYQHCHTFEACGPVDANLDKLIMWIEEGKKRSWNQRREALEAHHRSENLDLRKTGHERLMERLPYKLDFPLSGRGGGRGSKTAPILKTAEQLGLPVSNNKFVNGRMNGNTIVKNRRQSSR